MISKNEKMLEIFGPGPDRREQQLDGSHPGGERDGKGAAGPGDPRREPRSDAPFISVSCASLTESLLETELFGHEKGRSRGERHPPREARARAGRDPVLDEIGDISLKLQMDLLRVLEQKEFRRVGGTEVIAINSRILAATNRT